MPLYKHESGERVRTIPGSAEDERHAESEQWSLVDESTPSTEADESAKDVRKGTGRAKVSLSAGSES